MKCLVFNSYETANYFQKQFCQKGIELGKWPNDCQNYNDVFQNALDETAYFVPINAQDFDLLESEQILQLTDIQDSWYIKPKF